MLVSPAVNEGGPHSVSLSEPKYGVLFLLMANAAVVPTPVPLLSSLVYRENRYTNICVYIHIEYI